MPSAQIAADPGGRERLGASSALLSLTRSTGAALGTAAFGGLAFALLQCPKARARPAQLGRRARARPCGWTRWTRAGDARLPHRVRLTSVSPQGEVARVRQVVAKFDEAATPLATRRRRRRWR
jgi:hypothetical protein